MIVCFRQKSRHRSPYLRPQSGKISLNLIDRSSMTDLSNYLWLLLTFYWAFVLTILNFLLSRSFLLFGKPMLVDQIEQARHGRRSEFEFTAIDLVEGVVVAVVKIEVALGVGS